MQYTRPLPCPERGDQCTEDRGIGPRGFKNTHTHDLGNALELACKEGTVGKLRTLQLSRYRYLGRCPTPTRSQDRTSILRGLKYKAG